MKHVSLPALFARHGSRAGPAAGAAARTPLEAGYQLAAQSHRRHSRCSPAADGRHQPGPERDGPARSREHAEDRRPGRADAPARRLAHQPEDERARTARRRSSASRSSGSRTAVETKVVLPPNVRISAPGFSPDGKWLSFMVNRANGVELWMADTASAKAKAVTGATINALGGCSWLDDSSAMLCHFVVAGRGPAPAPPAVPDGPAHPGEHRQGRARADLPGPADQRA